LVKDLGFVPGAVETNIPDFRQKVDFGFVPEFGFFPSEHNE
jgi:hypothetical protein